MKRLFYEKKRYDGSITIEASLVLSILLLSLASMIRYAYTIHDTVTGSMILEETIERARNRADKTKQAEMFAKEGSALGNPRLYLGTYEIQLKEGILGIQGDAKAGEWSLHMERAGFYPEEFLRQQDALKKIKDRIEDR